MRESTWPVSNSLTPNFTRPNPNCITLHYTANAGRERALICFADSTVYLPSVAIYLDDAAGEGWTWMFSHYLKFRTRV